MCRHLGYVGPAVPVGELLTRGPHSLRTQAWAPRDMRGGGTVNADGFGVAWWREPEPEEPGTGSPAVPSSGPAAAGATADATGAGAPGAERPGAGVPGAGRPGAAVAGGAGGATVSAPGPAGAAAPGERPRDRAPVPRPRVTRYRNPAPIWTDPAVDEVLPQLRSTGVLAAVRSATVGTPIERTACAPFTGGDWAFSHNGVIPEWRRALSAALSDLDSDATHTGFTRRFETLHLLDAEAPTDSATLWVLLRGLLAGIPTGHPADPAAALRALAGAVLRHAPASRLTLLLGDGERLWGITVYHGLSALVTADSAVLASEPYDDDPGWRPIDDHMLVTAAPGELTVQPLFDPDGTKGVPR